MKNTTWWEAEQLLYMQLFTQHSQGGKLGTSENNYRQKQGGGFEPGTSRFQIQHLKPLSHAVSLNVQVFILDMTCIQHDNPLLHSKTKIYHLNSTTDTPDLLFVTLSLTLPLEFPVQIYSPFLSNDATMFCSDCRNTHRSIIIFCFKGQCFLL